MPAGELRERVRFERRKQTGDDGYGNVQYAWLKVAGPMGARIEPGGGNAESVLADQLAAIGTYKITVHWSNETSGLDEGDRVIDERSGAIFNIRSVTNPDERRRFLSVIADRGAAT